MMVEVWTAHGAGNWWKNMTFTDCEFEASNIAQLDFACYSDSGTSGASDWPSTVYLGSGCTYDGDCYFENGVSGGSEA